MNTKTAQQRAVANKLAKERKLEILSPKEGRQRRKPGGVGEEQIRQREHKQPHGRHNRINHHIKCSLTRGWQTLSLKDQTENMLGFFGPRVTSVI